LNQLGILREALNAEEPVSADPARELLSEAGISSDGVGAEIEITDDAETLSRPRSRPHRRRSATPPGARGDDHASGRKLLQIGAVAVQLSTLI